MRRTTTRARLATLLTVVSACALAGCGAGGTTSAGDGPPSELRLAIGGESEEGFDPTLGWGRYGAPLFQSTLLTREPDLGVGLDLATAYEVSDDGLTWTVDLRRDASFTDGEPVTARDVAYTFNTAAEQGGLTDVTALERAVVVDDDTVELRLTEPRSTFVNRLISLGIVPEHAHDSGYAQDPVGSGPFALVDWQQGQQLVVERNEDYYGEKPAFERLVFVFTDEDASLAAARAGQVDVAAAPSTLATQEIAGMRVQAVTSLDNRGIAFPTVPEEGRRSPAGHPVGNDVTADLAVRRAVNLAVDREALVEGVLEGFGSPATGPVDGAPWHEPGSSIDDDDVDAATAELERAGWTDSDGDGVREKDGTTASFSLLYPADDSLRQGLALNVVDMVARAGIEIRPEGLGWDEIYQRMHTDAVLFGWGSHDPTEMYNLYHSSMAGTESFNPGYYANPAVDRHLDAAMAATDPDEADRHWRAAQLDDDGTGFTAGADAAWAWLVNLEHTYFVDDCLDLGPERIEPHGHGWPLTAGISRWRWEC
ncbi:ABC transporter substrate-binding protein [Nocardioides campestrisoli]|uniref:ABC transporter substrate-binding protein n=1 Tax=Nocardioides campestrisoli TaxID=2736757 RepID=UPI00163D6165|nr:ABC transporter substrate-binding protein [Nocardioides campestrisoli]